MADLGLTIEPEHLLELGYTGAEGRLAAEVLIGGAPLPTALVVANVDAALGVLAELHKHGYRVPDDVSLIALHDVWYADATWPPITTLKAPLEALGAAAVSLLLDDERREPTHLVVTEPGFELTVRRVDGTSTPEVRSTAARDTGPGYAVWGRSRSRVRPPSTSSAVPVVDPARGLASRRSHWRLRRGARDGRSAGGR